MKNVWRTREARIGIGRKLAGIASGESEQAFQHLAARAKRTLLGDCEGQALVETSVTLIIMMMLITGVFQAGMTFANLISLTQGASVGAQTLEKDRLSSSNDPCKDTYNAIVAASPTLTPSKISITITMNNNTPITATTCSGSQTQLAMSTPVTVQATYPYRMAVVGISVLSGNLSSGPITVTEY